MNAKILILCALLAGCGAPADRLTDEQAAAEQQANIEAPQQIEVPPQTNVAPPATPTPSYKALGTEPGWTLTVTPTSMSYEGDYGATIIAEPSPPRFRPVAGRYAGTRLVVTIAPGPCSDGMSDRTYRDTVTVSADGSIVSGCGGGVIADTSETAEPDSDISLNAN
ncbi:MAG: hypothetical protein V4696_03295 [Pseudomonadota bacterium]